MTIKIKDIINKPKLLKTSNANNIFISMKAEVKKNPGDMKFQLDFENISQVSPFIFKQLILLMKSHLQGQYQLEIINGTALIIQSFKLGI